MWVAATWRDGDASSLRIRGPYLLQEAAVGDHRRELAMGLDCDCGAVVELLDPLDFEAQTGEPPSKVYRIDPAACCVCDGRGCEFCPSVEVAP